MFGGTAGAQIQSGHVVIGLEADIDWANMKGSATYIPTVGGVPITPAAISATTNIDWEATARARIGYAEQNWLFYATGGLAMLGTKTNVVLPLGLTCGSSLQINCSGTNKQIGAALGAAEACDASDSYNGGGLAAWLCSCGAEGRCVAHDGLSVRAGAGAGANEGADTNARVLVPGAAAVALSART